MIVRPGPRCSIARMPAREARDTSIPAGRCPATGMPSLLASATAGKKTSGVISAILMKSAPSAAWSRTAATASAIVPAFSGVSSAPGSATTSGESAGSGSVPADRSRSSCGDPPIWRKPVMPLASMSSRPPAGCLSLSGCACMSRKPGIRYLPDPSTTSASVDVVAGAVARPGRRS